MWWDGSFGVDDGRLVVCGGVVGDVGDREVGVIVGEVGVLEDDCGFRRMMIIIIIKETVTKLIIKIGAILKVTDILNGK